MYVYLAAVEVACVEVGVAGEGEVEVGVVAVDGCVGVGVAGEGCVEVVWWWRWLVRVVVQLYLFQNDV